MHQIRACNTLPRLTSTLMDSRVLSERSPGPLASIHSSVPSRGASSYCRMTSGVETEPSNTKLLLSNPGFEKGERSFTWDHDHPSHAVVEFHIRILGRKSISSHGLKSFDFSTLFAPHSSPMHLNEPNLIAAASDKVF